MRHLKQVREIPFPAAKVWDALADFGEIHRFHPEVRSSSPLSGKSSGVGSRRRCNLYQPGYLDEEVSDWQAGKGYTVRILDTSLPIKDATATFQIVSQSQKSSTVSLEMRYRPKFGLFGRLMDRLVMERTMNKAFAQVLKGLEDHLATGRVIGKKGALLGLVAPGPSRNAPPPAV